MIFVVEKTSSAGVKNLVKRGLWSRLQVMWWKSQQFQSWTNKHANWYQHIHTYKHPNTQTNTHTCLTLWLMLPSQMIQISNTYTHTNRPTDKLTTHTYLSHIVTDVAIPGDRDLLLKNIHTHTNTPTDKQTHILTCLTLWLMLPSQVIQIACWKIKNTRLKVNVLFVQNVGHEFVLSVHV